jgi:hypothetical protein
MREYIYKMKVYVMNMCDVKLKENEIKINLK